MLKGHQVPNLLACHRRGFLKREFSVCIVMDTLSFSFYPALGVYTRNRNFRLFLSCKLGKNNPLVLAKENKYKPKPPKGITRTEEEQIFLDSLVTNIP